ncbi:MAG: tRNA dihydrouridine synthase DusB [Bacteroidetes bacterium]|nr:tRNA dihydrouridine synthase DusB [Bacteroidota bacterium]
MVRIGQIEAGEFPVILAPMEDVTDSPFRSICRDFGADVLITEFIAAEGLIRDAWKSRIKMQFEPKERPIGIQIFGANIDSMKKAAEAAENEGPDFIDLNFGCPVRKIVMKGGGAALLQDIPKMTAMAGEVVKSTKLPVTAKTRLGWDEKHLEIVEIAERLQDVGIQAISIHGRTRTQLYGGKADWTLIGEVKNNPRMHIPVFGNGDIDTGPKAKEMKDRYGVDGILIGRAAVGNPWIFAEVKAFLANDKILSPPSVSNRIKILRLHLEKSLAYKGERATLFEMRKLYSGYFKGIAGFKPYRMKLVTAGSLQEIDSVLAEIQEIQPHE